MVRHLHEGPLMLERRSFLQSLVAGVTSAGVLVKATPAEVEAFAVHRGDAVVLGRPAIPAAQLPNGMVLYDAAGRAVMRVTSFDVKQEPVDLTSHWDDHRVYVPGDRRVELHGIGLAAAHVWLVEAIREAHAKGLVRCGR
ncbi:MAG: hypothetical protein AB7R67_21750 [Vicinamibacterales bacterium]